MVDEYPIPPAQLPGALAECPSCGGAIHVVLRDRPPVAYPVGTITLPPLQPKHCPHCGTRLWIALRPRAPIVLPANRLTIALEQKELPFPAPKGNVRQTDETKIIPKDPPLT